VKYGIYNKKGKRERKKKNAEVCEMLPEARQMMQ
jgi:hypothetical protein